MDAHAPLKPRFLALFAACAAMALPLGGGAAADDAKAPRVLLETSMGNLTLELASQEAPATTENFLAYVRDQHYDGTIFHRVIDGFMVQGGGFDADFQRRKTRASIPNEADNGLKNRRGTLAMARTPEPHSASDQFFINVADNAFLDFRGKTPSGWGYAVFGRVIEGMETLDRIRQTATGTHGGFQDVPKEAVVIRRATLLAE